jgi:hypothetical protein
MWVGGGFSEMTMARLVYIASAFENAPAVRALAARLPAGWSWSYDWTGHTFDDDPAMVAREDASGVARASAVIALLPGGFGTHVEIGMALGAAKPLCIVGDPPGKDPRWPRCPFYLLADRVADADAASAWLERLAMLWRPSA